MSEEIKAITTYYNGYKFRSRLEARWAVFFDEANIKYEYEPEGFKANDGTCYLPDFYLPLYNTYVEVKPPRAGAWEDLLKASKFVGNSIQRLLLLPNIPKDGDSVWYFPVMYWHPVFDCVRIKWCPFLSKHEEAASLALCVEDTIRISKREIRFFTLDKIKDELRDEVANNIILNPIPGPRHIRVRGEGIGQDEDEKAWMNYLYSKARQARFEHGEKG